MYVCLCRGVSDRVVQAAVREGAGSVREVGRRCGAGTGCGACHGHIREIIADERQDESRVSLPMVGCPA
jgi:bacterioferritin-associated ferredoxin